MEKFPSNCFMTQFVNINVFRAAIWQTEIYSGLLCSVFLKSNQGGSSFLLKGPFINYVDRISRNFGPRSPLHWKIYYIRFCQKHRWHLTNIPPSCLSTLFMNGPSCHGKCELGSHFAPVLNLEPKKHFRQKKFRTLT